MLRYLLVVAVALAVTLGVAQAAQAQAFNGSYSTGTINLGQSATLFYTIQNTSGGTITQGGDFTVAIPNAAGGASPGLSNTNCTGTFTDLG